MPIADAAWERFPHGSGIGIRGIGSTKAQAFAAAYKDVSKVIETADEAGLSRPVARLVPEMCIKG